MRLAANECRSTSPDTLRLHEELQVRNPQHRASYPWSLRKSVSDRRSPMDVAPEPPIYAVILVVVIIG
jgi:hypothetical protein